jgi:hypothetical protein
LGYIITDLSNLEITADGDLVLRANLSSQTDINLTSHHGDITQSGDIKAAQNIDELRIAILQEWQQFPQERLRRLV